MSQNNKLFHKLVILSYLNDTNNAEYENFKSTKKDDLCWFLLEEWIAEKSVHRTYSSLSATTSGPSSSNSGNNE